MNARCVIYALIIIYNHTWLAAMWRHWSRPALLCHFARFMGRRMQIRTFHWVSSIQIRTNEIIPLLMDTLTLKLEEVQAVIMAQSPSLVCHR